MSALIAWLRSVPQWLTTVFQRALDWMKLLTERIMGMLRLLATAGLLLIVLFVVYKALQSTQLVLVKPFTVPKGMSDIHPDSGRVIASNLKRELLLAEQEIYDTVKRTSNDGKIDIDAVTGNGEDFLLGANIKLPETGIALNDVVEFIGSLFGRRTLNGTVYQDQGELFLQVELAGRSLPLLRRSLEGRDPKALNMDLINAMLLESRPQLLSLASPSHNLYYYCTGTITVIHHPDSPLQQWFDYCTQLQNQQLTPAELGQLLDALHTARHRHQHDSNDTLRHIIGQTLGAALDKAQLLCPDYPQTKVCEATPEAVSKIALRLPNPESLAETAEAVSLLPELPDARAFASIAVEPESRITVLPAPPVAAAVAPASQNATALELPSVQELQRECRNRPAASAADKLASNRAEEDATLLFNNNRPIQALETYVIALRLNCQNAFAWANLGVLLLTPGSDIYSPVQAAQALNTAVSLNPRIDWMQNSLCLARAYNAPLETAAEWLKTDTACQAARTLNPANKVLLDKQFFIGLAERAQAEAAYAQAFSFYQIALSAERKRDCSTSKVIEQLALLESQHAIQGAKQTACAILQDAVPLPAGKVSACEAKLAAFVCP